MDFFLGGEGGKGGFTWLGMGFEGFSGRGSNLYLGSNVRNRYWAKYNDGSGFDLLRTVNGELSKMVENRVQKWKEVTVGVKNDDFQKRVGFTKKRESS